MNRLPAFVAAAALLSVLAGCAPGTPPAPSGSPGAVTGSTATPAGADPDDPESGHRPSATFGSGCADLVPLPLVTAIVPSATSRDLMATEYATYPAIPWDAPTVQVGGLVCEWSDGDTYGDTEYAGIQLTVLQDTARAWTDYAASFEVDPAEGLVSCDDYYCAIEMFAAGYWFSADVFAPDAATRLGPVRALAERLRDAAGRFGAAGTPWKPEGWTRVPDDCAILVPGALVDEMFGAGHDLAENVPTGAAVLDTEARTRAESWGCGWYGDEEQFAVDLLNGGAWLGDELDATDGTPLPLSGLTSADSAAIECDGSGCQVDLLVAGNWITAVARSTPDDSAAATRLAAHLVGVLRG